jgi:hypothetical protein
VGHEEQFMALLTVIEEQRRLEESASLSKLGNRGSRERNARLFEDVETSMVELRKRLLNSNIYD